MRRPLLLGLAVLVSVAACGDDTEIRRDGGGGTGGSITDGGAGTGGSAVAGNGGGDGGVPTCPVSSFVTPTAGQLLTPITNVGVADADVPDAGGDAGAVVSGCAGGTLAYDIKLATSAANGSQVALFNGSAQIGTATANGAVVEFKNIELSQGPQTLTAQVVGVPATCAPAMVTVTVDCMLPTCSITKPVISSSHPKLNNVASPNGDRVSSPGSDYQVAFEVATNIENGQPVRLEVASAANSTAVTMVSALVNGGKATFPGVTLRPDGDFLVQAVCTNAKGLVSRSVKGTYPVDTEAPQLTVTTPTNGKHYNPSDLTNGSFNVCVTSTSTDVANVPVSSPSGGKNLCAGIGSSGECVAVTSGTNGMDCVPVACLGGAAFDVNVTLKDAAGNVSTTKVTGVTCSSTLPGVQIISPAGDLPPFSDVSKHLLASSAVQELKDLNPAVAGAQTNVVACTDRMGGVARLFAGLDGATLSQLGADFTVVAATTQDNCPAALPYVARWAGVTLPESEEDADGALKTATALRVDVTDVSTTVGPSPVVKLWVDSSAPVIAPNTPVPLCGRIEQSATDASLRVALLSTANDVKLTIQSPSGTNQYTPMARTGAVADFGNLPFQVGENQVSATSIEPAGNTAALASPCVVRVGLVPTVTWEAPVSGANLCAAGGTGCQPDSDAGTPGWQGTLRVLVNVNGAPATTGTVTFLSGDTELATVNIDGTGHAELPNVSLPDANPVTLRARTSDITGTGTGSSTLTVSVDTVPPNAIATLTPVVKLRRQTTFNLQWAAPADGSGGNVASYLVRVSTAAINDGNFAAATNVPFTGAAAAAGSPDAIDVPNLLIEHDYYFAVAPVDSAGNRGPLVTAGPVAAHFNQTIVAAPAGTAANARFGAILDGAADVNGDGRSDMLVGTVSTQNAYIFLGATDFTTAPGPAVTITGPASSAFARSFIDIGDIDADGRSDIAVSAPRSGNGKVYIFKGRTTWNAAYAATAADYTIDLGAAYVGSEFGSSMAKLGDVDGDGVADFAIGAPNYGANRGRVVIVLGKAGFDGSAPSTIIIDGEPSTAGLFGYRIAGSAPMYTTGAGNTVIISAPVAGTNARGRVYTFQGLSTNPGSYDATNARDKVEGGVDNASYGSGTIAPLGPLGASPRALVISSPGIAPGGGQFGYADVWLGAANAPLGTAPKRFISTAATTVADQFGRIASTSLSSGVDAPVNIVGDSSPDLAVVGTTEGGGPARVYLVDGSTIPGLPALNNIVMTSTVTLPLPAGWASVTPYEPSMLLRDVNGDGFGDIAVGEYNTPTLVGRFVVFW